MFCNKCGASVPAGDAFCSVCGHAMSGESQPIQNGYGNTEQTPVTRNRSRLRPAYAVIAGALIVIVAAGAYIGIRMISDTHSYRDTLSDAEKAAADGDISEAVSLYREVLAVQPDDQYTLDLLDALLSDTLAAELDKAKRLSAGGKPEEALDTLEKLPIERGDKVYSEYQEYIRALSAPPVVASIDTSAFPTVYIHFDIKNNNAAVSGITIEDSGGLDNFNREGINGNTLTVSYTAEVSPDSGERRELSIALVIGEFTFPLSGEYVTPVLSDASVTLVSTDFSDYPTVRAYFRVEDMATEQSVANIGPNGFAISERISGGAYVAREVTAAEQLVTADGNFGINISLVADKSDSIGSDMAKIKSVMREFVGSIALTGGDRAELIAFDDVVQLMCTFTDDAALLSRGIDNMAIDGATAFYDAVYQGVRNAALQGGARCVIAFTDGEDNRSRLSANEVIRFANEKQVPLYIIGVGNSGSPSHTTLKSMASDTHGQYWYIDDLYDLTEIYTQIYGELQELYVVCYESDEAADPLAERGLEVSVRGGGYQGYTNADFSPAKTASGGGSSRYELFLEDVSWDEASARCLERGGHLVTITSKAEEDEVIALAEARGVKYIWIGGYTSYDSGNNVFGHWITGEDFTYENWMQDEPSRSDRDGTPEWYLMLWQLSGADGWCWNDQRGELISEFPYYSGKLAYVCEYEA